MKYLKLTILFCLSALIFTSCEDDDKERQAQVARALKQNDSILKKINNNWRFDIPTPTPKVQERIASWNEWQQFRNEMNVKPAANISAYKQKVKSMATRADQLKNNIPPFFDKPAVRSRISVLITKTKSLYTYINISVIPEKKVVSLINEITKETTSLQNQLNEIIVFSEIPTDVREEEMLKELDTTWHTNPDIMNQAPQGQQQLVKPNIIKPHPSFKRLEKPVKLKPAN